MQDQFTRTASRAPDVAEFDVAVNRIDGVADGVLQIWLSPSDGGTIQTWEPGAHIDLILPTGTERQYSLMGDPRDRSTLQIAVLREVSSRGGSAFIHEHLRVGDRLKVRGPRNHFQLLPADNYLFIAGGIGVTPILPMVNEVNVAGADWTLLYGGRTKGAMAFADDLVQAFPDRVVLVPQDEAGLIDLPSWLTPARDETLVYCCGPESLLNAVEDQCASWPEGSLVVERFAPKPVTLAAGSMDTFQVECRRSGVSLIVSRDESILTALLKAGIDWPSSCEEGTCGTCEAVVLDGLPDHRDSVLTSAEAAANDLMMVCVSRSLSAQLVLDI